MNFTHPILDRVVTYKRLTRRTYTWWRYTIKDNKITIMPLKDSLPSLDVIFNSLLRDIEFIHLFMNDKYLINKNDNMISHVDLNNNRYFTLFKDNEYKKLFKINLQSKEIGEPIIDLSLDNFLSVLRFFYPKYIIEDSIILNKKIISQSDLNEIFFTFNIVNIKKKPYYLNSYINLVDKFKLMNSDINTNYIFSRHLAGFSKSKRKLGLYSYSIIKNWDETSQNNRRKTFREILQDNYSKNLSMIFIVYFKNNYEIKDKMTRKFINNMMKLFDDNGFIFY